MTDKDTPTRGMGPELGVLSRAERQLRILRDLGSKSVLDAPSAEAILRAAAVVLHANHRDIPFALFYLTDDPPSSLRLVARAGVEPNGIEPASASVDLLAFPLDWRRVIEQQHPEVLTRISPALMSVLGANTPQQDPREPTCQAIVLPLGLLEEGVACGILVCGVNSEWGAATDNLTFFELVAAQIGAAFRKVKAVTEERRRAENANASLYSLFMQVPVPACVLHGENLVFESANAHFCQMMGRHNLVGRTFDDAFPELQDQGSSGQRFSDLLRGVISTGILFEHRELPATITRNGKTEEAYFNAVFAPITSPNGAIERVMAVGTEITNEVVGRVKAEQGQKELEATSAELRAASALRDDFLTVASHELRTPLTTLGLQIDGLLLALHQASRSDTPVPKLLEKANKLRKQADRLETLIEGMLDVFSLGSNNVALQLSEVDLVDAARSVISRLALEFRSIHIDLRAEPSHGMWDRTRVEQVITALVSNALKFGASRPIEVGVGGSATSGRIWVKDRGIGIDPADQQRIFGRFVRAAPSNQYAGFGLGLWIVHEIVKAMDGQVQVQSQLGMGSTFTVELPRSV